MLTLQSHLPGICISHDWPTQCSIRWRQSLQMDCTGLTGINEDGRRCVWGQMGSCATQQLLFKYIYINYFQITWTTSQKSRFALLIQCIINATFKIKQHHFLKNIIQMVIQNKENTQWNTKILAYLMTVHQ